MVNDVFEKHRALGREGSFWRRRRLQLCARPARGKGDFWCMSSLDAKCVEAYLGLPFELLFSVQLLRKLVYVQGDEVVYLFLLLTGKEVSSSWSRPCCCCYCSTAWISNVGRTRRKKLCLTVVFLTSSPLSYAKLWRTALPGSCCASVVCPLISQEQVTKDVSLTLARGKFGVCTAVAFASSVVTVRSTSAT